MKIFLIGYMGSGKSTVGKRLASLSSHNFIDLDSMIEAETDHSIAEWFEIGEHRFREVEALTLRQTADFHHSIISTGGGTPCFHDNMNWMKSQGLTVYLQMLPGALLHRLVHSKKDRPLLKGKNDRELLQFIQASLAEREPFYQMSHYIVSGENLDVKTLWELIQKGESEFRMS